MYLRQIYMSSGDAPSFIFSHKIVNINITVSVCYWNMFLMYFKYLFYVLSDTCVLPPQNYTRPQVCC